MKDLMKHLITISFSVLAIGMVTPVVTHAGCPCSGGPSYAGPAPMPLRPPVPPMPMMPRNQIATAPPAGTLGQTYSLPSRDIPADKHPRIAMLDVIAPNATSVRVENVYFHREEDEIDGFQDTRLNGLWSFETEPLIPGNPHIYKVVFRYSDAPDARETVRYVRLVPGRILELSY